MCDIHIYVVHVLCVACLWGRVCFYMCGMWVLCCACEMYVCVCVCVVHGIGSVYSVNICVFMGVFGRSNQFF